MSVFLKCLPEGLRQSTGSPNAIWIASKGAESSENAHFLMQQFPLMVLVTDDTVKLDDDFYKG